MRPATKDAQAFSLGRCDFGGGRVANTNPDTTSRRAQQGILAEADGGDHSKRRDYHLEPFVCLTDDFLVGLRLTLSATTPLGLGLNLHWSGVDRAATNKRDRAAGDSDRALARHVRPSDSGLGQILHTRTASGRRDLYRLHVLGGACRLAGVASGSLIRTFATLLAACRG